MKRTKRCRWQLIWLHFLLCCITFYEVKITFWNISFRKYEQCTKFLAFSTTCSCASSNAVYWNIGYAFTFLFGSILCVTPKRVQMASYPQCSDSAPSLPLKKRTKNQDSEIFCLQSWDPHNSLFCHFDGWPGTGRCWQCIFGIKLNEHRWAKLLYLSPGLKSFWCCPSLVCASRFFSVLHFIGWRPEP